MLFLGLKTIFVNLNLKLKLNSVKIQSWPPTTPKFSCSNLRKEFWDFQSQISKGTRYSNIFQLINAPTYQPQLTFFNTRVSTAVQTLKSPVCSDTPVCTNSQICSDTLVCPNSKICSDSPVESTQTLQFVRTLKFVMTLLSVQSLNLFRRQSLQILKSVQVCLAKWPSNKFC